MKSTHVLVAAAAALIVYAVTASPPAQAGTSRQCQCWPPHPSNIVGLDGEATLSKPQEFLHIYAVPLGRHLVITDVEVASPTSSHTRITMSANLAERLGSLTKVLRHATLLTYDQAAGYGRSYDSPRVGLSLSPGSYLGFHLPVASGTTRFRYHIRGYLTDQ